MWDDFVGPCRHIIQVNNLMWLDIKLLTFYVMNKTVGSFI